MAANPLSRFPRKLPGLSRSPTASGVQAHPGWSTSALGKIGFKLSHLKETEVFASLLPAERTWLAEASRHGRRGA